MFSKRIIATALIVQSTICAPSFAQDGITIGGRIQADYAFYDDDVRPLDNGGEIRRARLFAKGDLAEDWGFKLQLDFAGGDTEIKDAFIEYKGLNRGSLKVGNFKVPVGLEEITSSKYITFLERSLPITYAKSRRLAIGYDSHQAQSGFAAALFGEEPNDEAGGHGFAARYYLTPVRDDQRLLHLGASFSWEDPENGGVSSVRFRARPESHVTNTRLVDTRSLSNVKEYTTLGVEAAAVMGRFSAQAEYLRADVDQPSGDNDFDGYYATLSWFLTDDFRPYKNGYFDRVRPSADSGAWEVALRYSTIDLTDGLVTGGEEENLSIALNWYPKKNIRFMANYINVNTDIVAGNDDPGVVQFRVAVDF